MIQTQKRELIKKIVDCAIGRMLECKREVVKLDCSHFQYIKYILSYKIIFIVSLIFIIANRLRIIKVAG